MEEKTKNIENSSVEPIIVNESELIESEKNFNDQSELKINFRHPQQILNNKEIQILLSKKEEELSDDEKIALHWLMLRLKNHNSKPKKIFSSKKNALRKKKRKISKASRKANR